MLMALPFVFTSCSDDDDEVSQTTLEGTVWIAKENDDHYEFKCSFYKSTFKIEVFIEDEIVTISGEYEYEYPFVWLYNEDGEVEKITISDGNKFILLYDDGTRMTFVKE